MSNLNNLSPQEQACVSEVQKAPEAQRQSTFEKACNAITDKTRIALLAATLSLSLPAGSQNLPHYVIDEVSLTTLPQSAQILKPTLANISKQQAALVKSWEIQQLYPVQVQVAEWLKTRADLEYIQTGLSRQTPINFSDLTGQQKLILSGEGSNYVPVMLAVHSVGKGKTPDVSWRQKWGKDNTRLNLSPEEVKAATDDATREWMRLAKKPNEWVEAQKKAVIRPEIQKEYEALFNAWLAAIPQNIQTQWLLSRLDQASKEIMEYFAAFSQNEKVTPNVAYFVGSYVLMTVPNAKVTVLQIGNVKYAFASADDIKKSPLGKSTYINQILQINDVALKQFSSQAVTEAHSLWLAKNIKGLNKEISQSEQRIAQNEKEIAQSKERTAQHEKSIASLHAAGKLRDEIYEIIKTLNPNDQKSVEMIQKKLGEMKKILQEMDKNTDTYKILEWAYKQSVQIAKTKIKNISF